MNVERLNTLIKYMRSLPKSAEKHFNMRWWVNERKKPKDACPIVGDKKRLMHCGTSACALGWAGTCKALQKQGLIVLALQADHMTNGIGNTLLGKTFFDLTEDQFDDIFGDNGNDQDATPKGWADRVEQYLADNYLV